MSISRRKPEYLPFRIKYAHARARHCQISWSGRKGITKRNDIRALGLFNCANQWDNDFKMTVPISFRTKYARAREAIG